MKLCSICKGNDILLRFLTHTVQMKLIRYGQDIHYTMKVLNPHGSDETYIDYILEVKVEFVLNPHGSDETIFKKLLIISHTWFLTHTVQMKQQVIQAESSSIVLFLTHTVQMKQAELIPIVMISISS